MNSNNLNQHNISIILKEIVRRILVLVKQERFLVDYKVDEKSVDYKKDIDFVTSADKKAQALYLKLLKENFPGYGIVAEEDELDIPCTIPGKNLCFFVDPLDGTKAYIRKQSHAVSTMLALCNMDTGEYLACIIGDINTAEIYYFVPESEKIYRLTAFEQYERLSIKPKPLSEQYLLLRDDVRLHGQWINKVTNPKNKNKLFKSIEIESGSIGTMMMRLVKDEVGGVVLKNGTTTPWDANPVNGFLTKMNFMTFEVKGNKLKEISQAPIFKKTKFPERIIIHRNNYQDLLVYINK